MDTEEVPPIEPPTTETSLTRTFYVRVGSDSAERSHHIDHTIRGNHVGWPRTPEGDPFTDSLAIYPLLVLSLYPTRTPRGEAGYWAGFFAFSAGMLAYFHIGSWVVGPPQDAMEPYSNPAAGYLAFGIGLALIASVVIGSVYAAALGTIRNARVTEP